MTFERILVWLAALLASVLSILAYARPGATLPADPVVAALLVAVACPFLFVFGGLLLDRPGGGEWA